MSSFRRDIRFLLTRRDAWRFGILLAMLILASFLELLSLAIIPPAVTFLQQSELPSGMINNIFCRLLEILGADAPLKQLWMSCGILLGVYLLTTCWEIFCLAIQYHLLANRRIELSGRLLRAYQYAPAEFHASKKNTELLNMVVVECDNVIQGVVAPLLEFFRYSTLALCTIALLLWQIPGMTMAALVMLGLSTFLVMSFRNRRLRCLAQQEQRGREQTMTSGNEVLEGRIEAAIYGRRKFFEGRFREAMRGLATAQGRNNLQLRSAWPLLGFLSIGTLLSVILGTLIFRHGNLTTIAPSVALLAMALVRLRNISVNIMQNYLQLKRFMPSIALVCEDLRHLESLATEEEDSILPMPFQKSIVLQDVTFAYPGSSHPALSDISLEIPRGNFVGIVGANGCGKSTLLNLLLGFLRPQKGVVSVDGSVLIEKDLAAWRHAISYVPQKPFLLDGTLKENIVFGTPQEAQNPATMKKALALSQLAQVVEDSPQGLDIPLGEHGQRFSGGQCQRTVIARALYRNSDILILDEATSALDQGTETAFAKALNAVRESGVTTIMVTHRLDNVRSCDRIFFLKDGRLAAIGTYDELLKKSPDFLEFATR